MRHASETDPVTSNYGALQKTRLMRRGHGQLVHETDGRTTSYASGYRSLGEENVKHLSLTLSCLA